MYRAAFVALCLLTATTAHAQTTYFYDGQGRPAGSANRFGNRTQYYDGQGRPSGSSNNFGNQTNYYDAQGRPAGNSQRW